MTFVLALAAAILVLIELVRSRGQSLLAWATLLLAAIFLVGRI